MNQVSEEKKESMTKVLAILGFIAVIIFAVWLAVQIVRVIPSAFSSLASIAEVVYNYRGEEDLEVSTQKSVLNAGESFTISWSQMRTAGSYTFSYACVDGVSIDIRKNDGTIQTIACDTTVALGSATSIEILIQSEKARFVDVAYTVQFLRNGQTAATASKSSAVTIVNASIPVSGIVVTTPEVADEEIKTPAESTPTKPTTPVYTAGTPVTVTKYVYITPVSDPKGDIDLQVTYFGVGVIKNGVFIAQSSIDADDAAAMQFEVKNIGTKTARDWSYSAKLPASISYKSGDQKALKPNERAVITLGFDGLSKSGIETVSVEVEAKGDVKKSNNVFSKTVKITN